MIAWLGLALAQQPGAPPMHYSGCTWTDAPFEKWALVQPLGAREPVVEVRGHGSSMISVTGALGQDLAIRTRFSGVWAREGVSVAGYADPADSGLFRLSGTGAIDLGPAAKVIVGGTVEPFGWVDGEPVVRGPRWDREKTKKWRGTAKLPCERLSVTRYPREYSDPDLVAEAFGETTHVRIEPDAKLKLRDRPGGQVVLKLRPVDYARQVYRIAESDGWTHIALPRWPGLVWHGWVRDLSRAEDGEGAGGLGVLGALAGGGESIPTVTCSQPTVLWAVGASKAALPLGMVAGGTALKIEAEAQDGLDVRPFGHWLIPTEGWRLVVRETGDCTRGVHEKPAADLDAVFDDLDD